MRTQKTAGALEKLLIHHMRRCVLCATRRVKPTLISLPLRSFLVIVSRYFRQQEILAGHKWLLPASLSGLKMDKKTLFFFLHRHYLLYKWKRLPLFIDVGAHLSVNHYSHCFVSMNFLWMTDPQVPLGVNGKQMFPGSKSVTCCECVNLNKCVCVCVCVLAWDSVFCY